MSSFPKKYVLIIAILVSIGIVTIFSINGTIPNFFLTGNLGDANSGESIQYKMNLPNQTLMFNTFSSYGLSTHSGRQIHAEYVSDTSSLIGKSIDSITVDLKREGSPSGIVEVGVFNTDRSIKQLFGKINTDAVSTSYSDYSFSLPLPQIYQIQAGDRIGIKFTGGDNANHIAIMTDQTNFFDGANSYHTYYTDSWKKSTSKDLYMILKSSVYDTGLTVSASLAEGTNSTTQLVTLISNKPSTIFFTNDGSTPTTSSTVYSSPIIISSTTTLKFFAMDSLENTSPTMVQIYTVFPSSYDVSQLYPTTSGGREWFSKWDNHHLRILNNGNRDPDDSMFILTGSSDSKLMIDGDGIATISGKQPRMYVNNETGLVKWKNTEVTIYAKRVSEISDDGSAGFIIGARSNHYNNNGCGVDTYYSRMQYDGSANFAKELDHPNDSTSKPSNNKIHWGGGQIPYNTWIGHKFVLRDYDDGKHVKMQMFLDKTDGFNGGDWKLVAEWNDDGTWTVPENSCGIPVNEIILDAHPSIFIRNTEISSALYKKFSVREIDPLP